MKVSHLLCPFMQRSPDGAYVHLTSLVLESCHWRSGLWFARRTSRSYDSSIQSWMINLVVAPMDCKWFFNQWIHTICLCFLIQVAPILETSKSGIVTLYDFQAKFPHFHYYCCPLRCFVGNVVLDYFCVLHKAHKTCTETSKPCPRLCKELTHSKNTLIIWLVFKVM